MLSRRSNPASSGNRRNILDWYRLAVVQIRDETNTKSIQRGGQAGYRNRGAHDLHLVTRVRHTIGPYTGQRANAAGDERADRRASSDEHMSMIMAIVDGTARGVV